MTEILNLAMPYFGLILLGVIATRYWHFGEEGFACISVFLIYFALPSLIFLIVAQTPFEKLIDWPFIAAASSVTVVMFLAVFGLSRWLLGTPFKTAVLQGTAGSYGNVGYMGLPLAVAFFGPAAAVPAALVFCFDCLVQFVLTAFLATLAHEANEDAHWGSVALRIAQKVATHPFIVATGLGAAASAVQFEPPGALGTLMDMLMKAAAPCALFALGVTVGMRRLEGLGPDLALVAGAKTLVQPVVAFAVMSLVPGIDAVWFNVAVMMAALPTASNAYILASQFRAYVSGASAAVVVTTAVSAVTVPLLIYGLRMGP